MGKVIFEFEHSKHEYVKRAQEGKLLATVRSINSTYLKC